MLVLSRKVDEQIEIEGGITLTVVEIRGNRVKLGIRAPKTIGVFRAEVARRIERDIDTEICRSPAEPLPVAV